MYGYMYGVFFGGEGYFWQIIEFRKFAIIQPSTPFVADFVNSENFPLNTTPPPSIRRSMAISWLF